MQGKQLDQDEESAALLFNLGPRVKLSSFEILDVCKDKSERFASQDQKVRSFIKKNYPQDKWKQTTTVYFCCHLQRGFSIDDGGEAMRNMVRSKILDHMKSLLLFKNEWQGKTPEEIQEQARKMFKTCQVKSESLQQTKPLFTDVITSYDELENCILAAKEEAKRPKEQAHMNKPEPKFRPGSEPVIQDL